MEMRLKNIFDSILFENVETVLKLIKSRKLKLAVCTNKMEKLNINVIERFGVFYPKSAQMSQIAILNLRHQIGRNQGGVKVLGYA